MASLWRTPTLLVFLDEDNRELARLDDAVLVPRIGENVQLRGVPYLVERVGYDIPGKQLDRVLVIVRPI